jgi:predicted house-cleaning noncanonical NTP pyrophosphatase (MazG superfamily)
MKPDDISSLATPKPYFKPKNVLDGEETIERNKLDAKRAEWAEFIKDKPTEQLQMKLDALKEMFDIYAGLWGTTFKEIESRRQKQKETK